MTYELAKEMKEAGFPQGEELYCACHFTTESDREQLDLDTVYDCGTERVSIPTLEELVEACGKYFNELWKEEVLTVKWFAIGNVMPGFEGKGATPNEAVARLWLALNKK